MYRAAVLVASCLALLLAASAPATAAVPFSVGPGATPDIAVDAAGKAHIAFLTDPSNPGTASYCQVARGTGACFNPETFGPGPGES